MVPNFATPDSGSAPILKRKSVWLAIASTLVIGSATTYALLQYAPQTTADLTPTASLPKITTVTALGRLEPQGEIIQLAAPGTSNNSRVAQLLVQEGDVVQAGQRIAILDSRDRLQANLAEAQEQVKVAEAELVRIRAGAKQGEIAAQRAEIARVEAQRQGELEAQAATIARLEAEVENAAAEYKRYQALYAQGATSNSERDSKQLVLRTAQRSLQEAQAVLRRLRSTQSPELAEATAKLSEIAEVRSVDVQVARADIDRAKAAVQQAQAQLAQAFIIAPQAGMILDIHTRPGELVGSDGIVELGQTQQMYAVAEVYQSDIGKVRPGQSAKIVSDSLPQALQGRVDWISAKVQRQNIINTDPSENIDSRIVEVHVRLDPAASKMAAKFTNLQVNVVIAQ